LLRNCPLKHVIAGKVEGWLQVKGRRRRRRKQLLHELKETIPKMEIESNGSHSVESSLLKRLWSCRETDYGINSVLGRCHICEDIGSKSDICPVRDIKPYGRIRGIATFILTSALRGG